MSVYVSLYVFLCVFEGWQDGNRTCEGTFFRVFSGQESAIYLALVWCTLIGLNLSIPTNNNLILVKVNISIWKDFIVKP
jgi:hypothetical protein